MTAQPLERTEIDEPISYDQIKERKFASRSLGTATLILAIAENEPDKVGEDAQLGAIAIAHRVSEYIGVDYSELETGARKQTEKPQPSDDDTQESVFDEGVTNEELLNGYEQGVNAMVRMGIFSPEMVIDIERKLLDPQRINLTTESFSGWSYSHIVFPERRAGIQIAPEHLKTQERLIKGYMEKAGLSGRLNPTQLRSLAIASAIMHEYGHTVDSYLQIVGANRLTPEDLDNKGNSIKDILGAEHRSTFWKVWDKADAPILQALIEVSGDVQVRREMLTVLGTEDLRECYIESISTGSENTAILCLLSEMGFDEEEVSRVETSIGDYYRSVLDDQKFFLRVAKQYGYDQEKYRGLAYRVKEQLKKYDFDIEKFMPFYGISPKQLGYYMPLSRKGLKEFIKKTS